MKKAISFILTLCLLISLTVPVISETTDPQALYEEGKALYDQEKYSEALDKLLLSAEGGNPSAQCLLGIMYFEGQGVERSYDTAAQYYQLAADQGDAYAQCEIGYMYLSGNVLGLDYDKAAYYLKMSADQGDYFAQFYMGLLCYAGNGTEQSYEQALYYFGQAADQGDPFSQYYAGCMYRDGEGTEASLDKAIEYFDRSAAQGYENAGVELARLYYLSIGESNPSEMAEQIKQIPEDQRYSMLQCFIGQIYLQGTIVDQSYEKAKEYFQLAADQGNEDAAAMLNSMNQAE